MVEAKETRRNQVMKQQKKSIAFLLGVSLLLSHKSSAAIAKTRPTGKGGSSPIYQKLMELEIPKQRPVQFDDEIAHLSASERKFRESLPTRMRKSRLASPAYGISQKKYRPKVYKRR